MTAGLETRSLRDNQPASTPPEGGRSLLPLIVLIVFAGVFALSALSWVQFFTDANKGNRTRLFTQTDFPAYVLASRLVASGQGARLYDLNAQYAEQNRLRQEGYLLMSEGEAAALRYPYPYTPVAAVLLAPLASLPPLTTMAVWDLINLAAFVGGLWLLVRSLSLSERLRWAVLLAGLANFPLITNLEQGQSSGLVMLALGGGTALLARERDLPAGLLYGLLLVKIQWLPFLVLVLLWKRRWRAIGGLALAGAALAGLVLAVIGWGWVPGYLTIFGLAQDFSPTLLLDPSFSHSFTGLAAGLLGEGSKGTIKVLNTALMVAFAVGLLYAWRRPWQPATPRWCALMGLTLLAAIFTQPQLNTHDLCLLAVPAALALACVYAPGAAQGARTAALTVVWLLYLAPVLVFLLGIDLPIKLTALSIALLLGVMAYLALRAPAHESATTPA